MVDIAIRDETSGHGLGAQSVTVHRIDRDRLAAFQTLTVADFIRHRVELEYDSLESTHQAVARSGLSGETVPPGWLWQQHDLKARMQEMPDLQRAIDAAIGAFANQSYLLFVNDRQVVSLDEPLDIQTLRDVLFLKLTPLQGG